METGKQDRAAAERKKRRLERALIGLSILAIIGLTMLQTQVVRLGAGVPTSHSVLVFAIINVNIILLFFLLILVLRNLYKIFFEEKKVIGAQLRTKLVVAFVSLTLVPTCLLFYAALQFITTGHDYWFDQTVEDSLVSSLVLAQYITDVNESNTIEFSNNIRRGIVDEKLYRPESSEALKDYLDRKRIEFNFALAEVLNPAGVPVAWSSSLEMQKMQVPPLPAGMLQQTAASAPPSHVDTIDDRDLIRVAWPLKTDAGNLAGYLVAGSLAAAPIKQKMQAVTDGLAGYRELKRLLDPIRVSHYIALTIVALLSIFISTWIGFHLANSITVPIMDLAEGTDRIANGDYDFTINVQTAAGEISTLVESFNRMTRDLKTGKEELTRKNQELQISNTELDQRRRYMEIILQNVAAGVISSDADGVIRTINNSAEDILKIRADQVAGRSYQEILAPEDQGILDSLVKSAQKSFRGSAEQQVRVVIGQEGITLHIHLTQLKDETGQELGLVIVFDDLTELEKAQRMNAWRDVARRIAHEIKNPLTPIQLSTQRLRKRYGQRLADDGELFDECTLMIIRQVEELKKLVNEFSNFARLPQANPIPNDLAKIVDETVVMYKQNHKQVEFQFDRDPDLPVFNLDREQIKRVMINLLDNALAAVSNKGHIEITLAYDKLLKMARLEIADDGIGIKPLDKQRLFEPYYSTKKSGTGLGLAIVSSIVADHNGFVRVMDNQPRGTRFIVELPVKV